MDPTFAELSVRYSTSKLKFAKLDLGGVLLRSPRVVHPHTRAFFGVYLIIEYPVHSALARLTAATLGV